MTYKHNQPLATKTEKELISEVVSGIEKYGSIRNFRKEKYPKLRPDGRYVVSVGTLHRIAAGNPPKTRKLRAEFQLASTAEVAVCPIHKIVHLGNCKLTFEQKIQFADMKQEDKVNLLSVYESLRLLSKLKELREASSGHPSNNAAS